MRKWIKEYFRRRRLRKRWLKTIYSLHDNHYEYALVLFAKQLTHIADYLYDTNIYEDDRRNARRIDNFVEVLNTAYHLDKDGYIPLSLDQHKILCSAIASVFEDHIIQEWWN